MVRIFVRAFFANVKQRQIRKDFSFPEKKIVIIVETVANSN